MRIWEVLPTLCVLCAMQAASLAAEAPATRARAGKSKTSAPQRAVTFLVAFVEDSVNMAQDGESVLRRVADTMDLYPLDKIKLVGYAYSGEGDAAGLARKRADFVKKRLVNQYRMKAQSIKTQAQVTDDESFQVEISIVREPRPRSPKEAMKHYDLGIDAFMRGDHARAREEWALCVKLDPANSDCAAGLQRINVRPAARGRLRGRGP